MKVSKRQLRRIIKEEKLKLLKEGGVGIGFSNWEVNRNPNFAKAYGKDARVVGLDYTGAGSARQNRLQEVSIGDVEDRAEGVMHELISSYLNEHLDTSGSNTQDAMEWAEQDFMAFCAGIVEVFKSIDVEDHNPEYVAPGTSPEWDRE